MEQDFAFVKGQAIVVSQLTNFLSSCNTWLMNFRFFFFFWAPIVAGRLVLSNCGYQSIYFITFNL